MELRERVGELLHGLDTQGAAGLILRDPVQLTDEVRRAVETTGVALLALGRGASWAHLAAMLRSLLA